MQNTKNKISTHTENTKLLVDPKGSDTEVSNTAVDEICRVASNCASKYGGYAGLNSGPAEVITVSYHAPNVLADKPAPDASY